MSDKPQIITKRVLTNMDRCVECGSCAAACHLSHGNMPIVNFASAGPALLPLICRQCISAPCVETCPVEAMVRDENGVVFRKLFRCIGCGSCVKACPFGLMPGSLAGVPSGFKSTESITGHQAAKCDLCRDRIMGDEKAEPRCVAACPAGALTFADEHRPTETPGGILGGRTTGEDPYKRR